MSAAEALPGDPLYFPPLPDLKPKRESKRSSTGPSTSTKPDPFALAEPKKRISRMVGDLLKNPTQPRWLLRDELERGVLAVIAGPRGSCKTTAVTHWIMRLVIIGEPVFWLCAEGGNADRLVNAWLKRHAPDVDPDTLPLHVVQRRYDLFQHDVQTVRAECEEIHQQHGRLSLIVADTYSKYSGALRENNADDVKAFVGNLDKEFRTPYDTSVLVVAHTGLSDTGRARGSSALASDTEAEYIVSRKPGGIVSVTRERFKATPELPPLVLQTEVIDLGYKDEKGRAVTALCIAGEVAVKDQPKESAVQARGKVEIQIMEAVRTAPDQCISIETLHTQIVPTMARSAGKRDTRDSTFNKAVKRLIETKGLLSVVPDSDGKDVSLPVRALAKGEHDPIDELVNGANTK